MKTKKIKTNGKKTLKNHFWPLVFVCIVSAFIGSEFSFSLSLIDVGSKISKAENEIIEEYSEDGDLEKLKVLKEKEIKSIQKSTRNKKIISRSNGVFSKIINDISTGSIFITITSYINSITGSITTSFLILIMISIFIAFVLWFFIINTFKVVSRRIFLESRIYDKVPSARYLFLQRTKTLVNVSIVMFIKFVYYVLWSFTIVGYFIKRYSYFLVPYILAENPTIGAKDAINLSRRMMNGHKMECFKYELSFIGWKILGIFTLEILDIFYTNPYKIASDTEFYVYLREKAIENRIKGYDLLKDEYLYVKPDKELLNILYLEDYEKINKNKKRVKKETGIKGFLANNLGIILKNDKYEEIYEIEEVRKEQIKDLSLAINGNTYPARLFYGLDNEKKKRIESLNYMRRYSLTNMILMFFIICFIGWIWEVGLHIFDDGVFVNRGVMHGPWLPIYGSGGILILTILYRLRKNPAIYMISTTILCGILEYFTSYFLEIVYNGEKWWDYSGYFLNINGRICAEGLLVFAIGGMALTYLLAPVIDNILRKLNKKTLILVSTILILIFIIDIVFSRINPNTGDGITKYSTKVEVIFNKIL